jgi:hypothetical protein
MQSLSKAQFVQMAIRDKEVKRQGQRDADNHRVENRNRIDKRLRHMKRA